MDLEITLENCMVLLEGYRGKDVTLVKVEKILDEICDDIRNSDFNDIRTKVIKTFSNDPRVNEVEKLLAKKFKAKKFELHLYDDLITNRMFGTNGFTMPQTFASFGAEDDGLSTGMLVYVNVAQNLIYKCDLSGGELLAIIIHEVGHNVRRDWLRRVNNVVTTIMDPMVAGVIQTGIWQELMMKGPRVLDKSTPQLMKDINKKIRILSNLFNGIKKYDTILHNIILILQNPLKLMNLINPISYIDGYIEEKYADSLATSFGYGYELSTALYKFDNLSHVMKIDDTPTPAAVVEDFLIRTMSILFSPIDVHPAEAIRINSQIKYMKKQLNDPKIPKVKKKELEESLDNMEKFMQGTYLNPKYEHNKKKPLTFVWNVLVHKINGLADIREMLNILSLGEA